ncbi:MAG: PP2C family protein-serine/threonine phosphatase [Anaerolineales bacterium]|nr:PP2C family protein-serine/threonine phosphatase [Anaerolineales bacterium]
MTEPDLAFGAPLTARYHRDAIDQILRCVMEGVYCAVLGPRLCGKTVLLRYIDRILRESLGLPCVYLDLIEMRASTLQGFFDELIHLTSERLAELTGKILPPLDESAASSAVFRGFLTDCSERLDSDLVLIIEHLEAVPTDLVQALLTSLRAAYMDQQTMEHKVTVVVSGALSLATLTVGESSPFRGIARRVFVGDLSESASQALVEEYLAAEGVSATPQAQRRLLDAASGDTYLIRKLCQRCAELARAVSPPRLRASNVHQITRRFLRDEVFQYAPLLEAVRLIEEDPDLLRCILLLLERVVVPKAELPLPLSPDLDPLYLTGVVDRVRDDGYRLQNLIYRQFLAQYFDLGRVGRMLAMAGRWDTAIDYLEVGIEQGDKDSRADLLPAAINSIYASQNLAQAAHFLIRGLSAAFGVKEALIWYAPPQEKNLRLIGGCGAALENARRRGTEMAILADRLEARAYRQEAALRGGESDQGVRRAIPLTIPGRNPIGVVTIYERLAPGRFIEQRERDLQIAGYLNQVGRAMQAVGVRRQELILAGRMQATLLPESPPRLPGWEMAAAWRPARETSGDFYDFIALPNKRLGVVIADVVDKGMGAALYMALSRTLIRSYANDYPERPDSTLQAVNRRVLADVDAGQFVTVFYGILNPASGKLTYCNAGHNPPLLLRAEAGRPPLELHRTGMALGVSEEAGWERKSVQLEPGALLLLYTDGLVDAQGPEGEPFGIQQAQEVVKSNLALEASALQDALLTSVFAFMGDEPQFDDITLLVMKRILQ